MLGVNVVPHAPEALKKVMEQEQLPWRSFADDGTISKDWNSPATPAYYVLDQQGMIRHKWIGHPGETAMDQAIIKLMQEATR